MNKEEFLYSFFDSLFDDKLETLFNVDCSGEDFRNDLDEDKLIEYIFDRMLGKEEFRIVIPVPYEEEEEWRYTYLKAESSDGYYIKFYGRDNAYASIMYFDDNGELIKVCNDMTKRIGYYIAMGDGDIREVRNYIEYALETYIEEKELEKIYDIKEYSEKLNNRFYKKSYSYIYHFKKKEV